MIKVPCQGGSPTKSTNARHVVHRHHHRPFLPALQHGDQGPPVPRLDPLLLGPRHGLHLDLRLPTRRTASLRMGDLRQKYPRGQVSWPMFVFTEGII